MTDSDGPIDPAFGAAIGRVGPRLLSALGALEQTFRHLEPGGLDALCERLRPLHDALSEAIDGFGETQTPPPLQEFRAELEAASGLALGALGSLTESGPVAGVASRALRAMHLHARAQARLYPLRGALPPVSAFFAEAFRHGNLASLESAGSSQAEVGLFRAGEARARGGFDLYVPESYDASEPWPLVVALHGGTGNGSDFLWSWLREARSRRCLLLAPTSRGSTWSLSTPQIDGEPLFRLVDRVATRWRVDRDRTLLTGLSDGATMTLLVGLGATAPFSHLAPVSGVLHPLNFALGNLDRARGRPIYLVHGALDWMFPVALAREAAHVLEDAGAELVYREIEDLPHAYPREENAAVIEWLDPRRAPPASSSDSTSSSPSSSGPGHSTDASDPP